MTLISLIGVVSDFPSLSPRVRAHVIGRHLEGVVKGCRDRDAKPLTTLTILTRDPNQ